MNALDVVHKDFLDARRAKIVWFVGVVYALLTALFVYWGRQDADVVDGMGGHPEILLALWNIVFVGAIFVPAVALVAAYLAIAGERESGSIKFLLSTPVRRRDVVLGKYVSRAAIVAVSMVLAFAVAAGLGIAWFPSVEADALVAVAALTTLYALAYVGVAIAISAATASRSRAMGGALAFYFATNLLVLFGDLSILGAVEYVLNDLLDLGVGQDPIQLFGMLISPTHAYLGTTYFAFPEAFMSNMGVPPTDELAWYLQPEVALALLLAWGIVPLLLGLRRFERADLG